MERDSATFSSERVFSQKAFSEKAPYEKAPQEKALAINLDGRRYGTFAEIGAGQEVVRWFFHAGGAAGTISKSISAYDMQVSDAIYGSCERYVCRERLETMLNYEYDLNVNRLGPTRGHNTAFFAFADTVVAQSYRGTNECHGWMGLRFQSQPGDEPSQIVLHVRMWDASNLAQQEALGIVGVNLIYGAFRLYNEPEKLLASLLDSLSTERIEVDMVEFRGIEFRNVDNRVMALRLVQLGLTDAALLGPSGAVLQPSEVLRKKAVIVERGRFRPVTLVNVDMLESTRAQLADEHGGGATDGVTLLEITMRNLLAGGEIDLRDFVSRAEVLAATGHMVLISNYFEYFRLVAYLRRYTDRQIALVMGAGSLADLFDESCYQELQGGTLEAFGRLFKSDVRVYVYPLRQPVDAAAGALVTAASYQPPARLQKLYQYLLDTRALVPLEHYREDVLHIFSHDVLELIHQGDPSWEDMVPSAAAEVIRRRGLFNYRPDS